MADSCPDAHAIATHQQWTQFVTAFENLILARQLWTHAGFLTVALWYQAHNVYSDVALDILRVRLRRFNQTYWVRETDISGFHETLMRFWMDAIVYFQMREVAGKTPVELLQALLKSELADVNLPLRFYSRERLYSAEAICQWVEPDVAPNPLTPKAIEKKPAINELRRIDSYSPVVELCGGSKETRYVLTSRKALPPTDNVFEWIQEYDGCIEEEAKREEMLGRQITLFEDGAVLLVDGEPVFVVGGQRGYWDLKALLQKLH
jgi:hypothetical protein